MRAIFGLLLLVGCAAPSRPYYESAAYKAADRNAPEVILNQEPPLSQQQLEHNTLPLTEPSVTPMRP
jgi:hypothetical protein